jgi:hypothetical protein
MKLALQGTGNTEKEEGAGSKKKQVDRIDSGELAIIKRNKSRPFWDRLLLS